MTSAPIIQVLSKHNYEDQHLISLPIAFPLPPLASSSLRIRTSIFSLTTNNFTYARIGHLLGWWDAHPLPPSIPAEFSNPKDYGRISCWGYGTVLESTAFGIDGSKIEVGTQVFGYLPIGTLPVDMHVKTNSRIPGQFFEISEGRKNLMPIYNRYLFYPPEVTSLQKRLDALFQVLFETSYMMNRFIFAWDPKELVQPSEQLGPASGSGPEWTFENAQIGEETVLLLFSASGKTALAFAHELKHGRPAGKKPGMVVAIGSDNSGSFTKGTGLYDRVLRYDADSTTDLEIELGLSNRSKIVVCDFGARDEAAGRWAKTLQESYNDIIYLRIGGEVVADSPEKVMEKLMAHTTPTGIQVNASGLRSQAMEILGEKRYFEEFLNAWSLCKEGGVVKGLRLVWGYGMKDVEQGWERLYKGELGPEEGLVFTLDGDRPEKP